MTTSVYSTLHMSIDDGVARIVLDNPPVNVLDATMMRELRTALDALRGDSSVRVIVFSSADPEFFLAHVDMRIGERTDVLEELAASAPADVNVFQAVGELLRHQPQVTIVKLAGKARGGGAEFVAAADMAFAAAETAGIGQIEALMGIVPGGGGTQYLRDRVGRNRALGVIEAAKRALPAEHITDGLLRENEAWATQIALPAVQQLMSRGLRNGAQTPTGERDLEELMRSATRR